MFQLKHFFQKGGFYQVALLACALLLSPVSALAAGTISIVPTADSTFNVVASNLDGAAGFDLTATFDPSQVSGPTVEKGPLIGNSMFASNTSRPNNVQFVVVNTTPFASSGVIATVRFQRKGTAALPIDLRGTVIDANGKKLTGISIAGTTMAQIDVNNPIPNPQNSPAGNPAAPSGNNTNPAGPGTIDMGGSSSSTTTTTSDGSAGTGSYMVGGTLTLPSDQDAASGSSSTPAPTQQEVTPSPAPMPQSEMARVPEAPAADPGEVTPAAKKPVVAPIQIQSVLEKFRLYTGEKTPKALVALFERDKSVPMTQSPAVALADGKSVVKVTISKVSGDRAPNFAFNGARYESLAQSGAGEWQIEVRPEAGAVRASINMLTEGGLQEYPLTVAPKAGIDLDKSGKVTEADFQRFLKERGTETVPQHDLNRDGRRDYIDDYIFTANYLAGTSGQAAKGK